MKDVKAVFVHLGHPYFDLSLFKNITNDAHWVKPQGGLWASPLNSSFGWKDWTKVNEFMQEKYATSSFKFELSDDARLLYIDNSNKLDELPKGVNVFSDIQPSWVVLDFEKLAEDYDAMLVLISEDHKLYWDLYGWDCDTLLVFNPDVIEVID